MATRNPKAAASSRKPSIFDVLGFMTENKKKWEDLSTEHQKECGQYMINRWLSMDRNLLPLVAAVQEYITGRISPRDTYKLYHGLLPQSRFYLRYVSGKKATGVDSGLVQLLVNHLKCSTVEAEEYIATLAKTATGKSDLEEFMVAYAVEPKQIQKILKSLK